MIYSKQGERYFEMYRLEKKIIRHSSISFEWHDITNTFDYSVSIYLISIETMGNMTILLVNNFFLLKCLSHFKKIFSLSYMNFYSLFLNNQWEFIFLHLKKTFLRTSCDIIEFELVFKSIMHWFNEVLFYLISEHHTGLNFGPAIQLVSLVWRNYFTTHTVMQSILLQEWIQLVKKDKAKFLNMFR